MNIAIIDDEIFFIRYLESIILNYNAHFHVFGFINEAEFYKQAGYITFDLIFIDVDLGQNDGIEIIRHIHSMFDTQIVCMTSYINRIYELDDLYLFGFLAKPFNQQKVNTFLTQLEKKSSFPVIWITDNHEKTALHLSEIIYIATYYSRCDVVTKDNVYESSRYLVKKNSDLLLKSGFIRIQQSFYVNMEHIQSLSYSSMLLDNGERLSIGYTFVQDVKTAYHAYISKEIL